MIEDIPIHFTNESVVFAWNGYIKEVCYNQFIKMKKNEKDLSKCDSTDKKLRLSIE